MILDLAAACVEGKRISVTSLSIASGVPPTTALRWIGELVKSGIFERVEDQLDKRRAFVTLSDKGMRAVAEFFASIEPGPVKII